LATTAGVAAGVGLGTATLALVELGFTFWLVCLFLLEQPSIATANTTANAAAITAVAGMPKPKMRPMARATLRGFLGSVEFICVILITSAARAAGLSYCSKVTKAEDVDYMRVREISLSARCGRSLTLCQPEHEFCYWVLIREDPRKSAVEVFFKARYQPVPIHLSSFLTAASVAAWSAEKMAAQRTGFRGGLLSGSRPLGQEYPPRCWFREWRSRVTQARQTSEDGQCGLRRHPGSGWSEHLQTVRWHTSSSRAIPGLRDSTSAGSRSACPLPAYLLLRDRVSACATACGGKSPDYRRLCPDCRRFSPTPGRSSAVPCHPGRRKWEGHSFPVAQGHRFADPRR